MRGPFVLPTGRIVDLLVAPDGEPGSGAKPLGAPPMPPRPWRPEAKALPPAPPESWKRFEAAEAGFAVSFPGPPSRTARARGSEVRAASGRAEFGVYAFEAATGRAAMAALEAVPDNVAVGLAGWILEDATADEGGVHARTLTIVSDGAIAHRRIVVTTTRAYILDAGARGASVSDEDVRRFFGSFQPIP